MKHFTAIVHHGEPGEGGFWATCLEVPGANGQGETKRTGSLSASITARVTRVLKNGDLQIRGQKNIRVNEEERTLILEGFIRPYDISPKNTIMSSQIADARITFNGFGILANKQKQGWLTNILEKILPF